MKKIFLISVSVVFFFLLLGTTTDNDGGAIGWERKNYVFSEGRIPEISRRINAFTFKLSKRLLKADEKNGVISAQSIFQTLAMSYIASGGKTKEELASVSGFPEDKALLLKELSALRKQFEKSGKGAQIEVSIANSLWLDSRYANFREEYVRQIKEAFDALLSSIDFARKNEVAAQVNRWASQQTHGRIDNVVSPENFNSRSFLGFINEPAMVAANAVYMKADWGSKFDKSGTRMRDFNIDSNTRGKVMMMHQQSLLNYAETKYLKFLEIPYIDSDYSMYIIMPRKILAIGPLMNLLNQDKLEQLSRNAYDGNVDVLLPKFEISRFFDAKDALSSMGVKSVFEQGESDLDEMINKKTTAFKIYISDIYQKAWIDVHEEGTEAAVVTASTHFSIGCSADGMHVPYHEFHADRPFVFFIIHNPSRSILFSGWYSKP